MSGLNDYIHRELGGPRVDLDAPLAPGSTEVPPDATT
jgi:hypothetical protein